MLPPRSIDCGEHNVLFSRFKMVSALHLYLYVACFMLAEVNTPFKKYYHLQTWCSRQILIKESQNGKELLIGNISIRSTERDNAHLNSGEMI